MEKFDGNRESMNILSDLYVLNTEESYWTQPYIAGTIPGPRYSFGFAAGKKMD